MPRPRKWRRVCTMPMCSEFGPENGCQQGVMPMTIDEYETIRLIDLEGYTQEQCAQQMEVARTTAQAAYASARRKIAQCIVNGLTLSIGGGEYRLCEHRQYCHGSSRCAGKCHAQEIKIRRNGPMKIAVTYENGKVFQHFGKTEQFKVYAIEDGKVASSVVLSANGKGHGELAGLLRSWEVTALICGGIGQGAKDALAKAGIDVYGGTQGDTDPLVQAFLAGTLDYNANVMCNHHSHADGSSCADHHHDH